MEDLSGEVKDLDEKLSKLTHLQNVQVKSEITSIQLEEQMDQLMMERQVLIKEKEAVLEENATLTEKLENLQKEKQEILIKLESYMQENIDLVDKLEKLSAEKVSSAESIEIVEGLTQQEKLELAAYQTNSNIPSDIKTSHEHLEESPELNESVTQLTEETSELLQKIELFTLERREVMEKMEQLTHENNQLNLKIKEIENNREVLAETYEQLQNEKESLDSNLEYLKNENATLQDKIKELESEQEEVKKLYEKDRNEDNMLKEIEEYKSLIEIQRQEIKELRVQVMGQDFIKTDKLELEAKINSLQLQYDNIVLENDTLMNKLKEQSEHVCQRKDLEEELLTARKRIEDFEKKISDNLEEIENYKSILDENKNELISSANTITELQSNVTALKNEVGHYNDEVMHLNSVITDLNAAIAHLEKENEENSGNAVNMSAMTIQLEELKQALTENIEQINVYQQELQNNSVTIIQLQNEIKDLNIKMLETEHLLESKNDELRTVQKEKEEKDNIIQQLQQDLKSKDENFHQIVNDLKQKYVNLQAQLETNTGSIDNIRQPLENKIQELEQKNKEQLEKMKIIAANLKKKTQALQNLEQKYTEVNEKWETEQKEKETLKEIAAKNATLENELQLLLEKYNSSQNDVANQSTECQKLKEELCEYKHKFNCLENMNTKLSEEISNYIAQYEDSQNTIREYEHRISELSKRPDDHNSEINKKNSIIEDLTDQLNVLRESSKTNSDALQMKIQEMEMFTETQDAELAKYKERVSKLEEGLSFMEERRMSLERTAQRLGAQLEEKTNECEEVSHTEDMLERRLTALISHDQIIEKKLEEVTLENEELNNQLKNIIAENGELKEKVREMKDLLNKSHDEAEMLNTIENEVLGLRKEISALENDKKNIKNEYEEKLRALKVDNEKMETELQTQLDSFDTDRKTLAEKIEHMTDHLKEYVEQQDVLTSEITEYKEKLNEQNNLIVNTNQAYNKLQEEFQSSVLASDQLKELIKNQEDTISQLNEQIVIYKDAETKRNEQKQHSIESEISQKSIQNLFNEPSQLDLASSFFVDQDTQHLRQTNENLIVQVNTLHKEKENIERILAETQHQLEETLQIATNKEEPLKSEELKSLKAQYNTLEMNYGKLSEENISLQNNIARLNEQLQSSNQLESQIENKSQEIRTFTWPGEEIIEVNISASSTDAPKIDNTKEELLNKIRSLEFMLHDTEQQKENAMIQCNALSEELTKLVYLQEQQKQLQQTANVDVESLIIPPEKTEMTSADLSQLHEYEFSPSKDIVDHQETIPVVEEVIEPKTSYLCYDPEEAKNKHVTDTFGENDDGWGWSSEEANLEQEYYEQASATPQSTQFKNQINVLEEKIKVLEQARERHLDEIQQSQLKSSKLIKKLKEFKAKNEELASQLNKKSDTFDDLNDAIQEELKTQIKNLEKKIKEISADLEKEKLEKESLLKRVDTLTATHERMVENKEKQDIEIMSWQRRCRELNEKLEQFEWGDDESPKHVKRSDQTPSETQIPDAAKCIQELNNTIKDLTLDNEELQALLEEQRNLRIAAEKSKTFEPVAENVRSESEYLVVVNERNSLQKDIDLAKENMIKLTEDYSNLLMVNEAIEEKCRLLTSENQQLREVSKSELDELARQIDKINVEKQNLIEEKDRNVCVIEELHQKLNNLQNNVEINANNERKQYEERISELNSALTSLNAQLYSLSTENNALQIKITDLERYKENFAIEINQKDVLISELNLKISNLEEQLLNMQNVNSEIIQIKESLTRKEEELANFSAKLLEKEQENEFKLSHTVQQLATEWAQKVDQRGYDVAESWKLHLEARENEFLEVESQLKKEIADFEEKYTTLVNENNELRKNVDAEIRNEVDRIAALQQQINERQHYINDLSKTLQDQQNEIEKQKIEISNLSASVVELKEQIDSKNKEINSIEETLKKKNDLLKSYEENDLLFKTEKETEIKSLKEALNLKDIEIHNIDNRFVQSLQQVEELSQINKNLVVDLEERIKLVNDLSKRLEDVENNKQVNSEQVSLLNQQIAEYQAQCSHYNHELQQRDMEIDALKQSMLMYHNMEEALSHKDIEIKQLKDLIEEKEREHSIVLDSSAQEKSNAIKEYMVEIENLKRKLLDSENQYEEILVTKDVDMQNLRAQLEEQIKRNESYQKEKEDLLHVQTELGIKTAECNEMSAKLQEQNLLISEEAKQLDDLREIIQDQVLKIEALQKELYDKSTMYDASIAEIDLTHKSETTRKSDKHVKFSDEIDVKNTSASSNEDDLSEPVSRAELDLALYMLHQRDVRCEELTVELMQLLEERDTLQLKLSNALREKEILMSKYEISPNLNESHSIIEQATEVSPVDVSASGSQELKPSASDPLISK